MADYKHADDGKIHTRFTELKRCTPGSIDRVVNERLGNARQFSSNILDWGSDRHAMFEEEGIRTRRLPECFLDELDLEDVELTHIEAEFAAELWRGLVVHSRPDAVAAAAQTVFDYKTAQESDKPEVTDQMAHARSKYTGSHQLKFYAFMLGLNGIRIKRGIYLIEVWDRAHENIVGYTKVVQEYSLADLGQQLPWVRERATLLQTVLDENNG